MKVQFRNFRFKIRKRGTEANPLQRSAKTYNPDRTYSPRIR